MTNAQDVAQFKALNAEIVSAFLSHNHVDRADIQRLITSTFEALQAVADGPAPVAKRLVPMVPIRKSITPDYLINLEDGRRYKSLKRNLSGRGMTPAQYREKWGLPADYPMVAPHHANQRSEMARASGLGRKAAEAKAANAAAPAEKAARFSTGRR